MGQGLDFLDGRGLPQGLTGFLIFLLPSASQGQAVLTNWISAIEPEDKGNEMEFNSASETKLDRALLLFVFFAAQQAARLWSNARPADPDLEFLRAPSWVLAGRAHFSFGFKRKLQRISQLSGTKIFFPGAPRHAT